MGVISIPIAASGLRSALVLSASPVARCIRGALAPAHWHPDPYCHPRAGELKRNYFDPLAWGSQSRICSPPESDSSSCDSEFRMVLCMPRLGGELRHTEL